MNKQNKSKTQASIVLTIVGAAIIILTPIVQPLVLHFLTQDCPMLGDVKECGLEVGLKNAFYADVIPGVWLVGGIVIFAIGIVRYFVIKKKSNTV